MRSNGSNTRADDPQALVGQGVVLGLLGQHPRRNLLSPYAEFDESAAPLPRAEFDENSYGLAESHGKAMLAALVSEPVYISDFKPLCGLSSMHSWTEGGADPEDRLPSACPLLTRLDSVRHRGGPFPESA